MSGLHGADDKGLLHASRSRAARLEHSSVFKCNNCLPQRDRRRRDAPGGTRNIQKLYRWEAYQRVTKFRALLPLTNNMEPYILGDFREMQVRIQLYTVSNLHSLRMQQ